MPIEFTPPRQLITAYLRLRERLRGGKDGHESEANQIKTETVNAVNGDGTYVVRGRSIGVAGIAQIAAGESVDVAWKNGRPEVILAHNARRAQYFPPQPQVGQPLVEELFVALRPTDGVSDVWFRNFDQCVPLHIERFGIVNPSTVKWGNGQNRFYIQIGNVYSIMKFDRKLFTGFTRGQNAASKLSLERTENLATNDMVLAALTYPTPSTIKANGPGANRISVSLDVDGALIGAFEVTLQGAVTVPGNLPAPNFDSSLVDATTSSTFVDTMSWPVIADLTNRIVLLSGFANPSVLAPFITFFDWNGTSRITQNIVDGHGPVTGFPRSVSWVGSNSFTTPISPPFEGHTEIVSTWQFGFSQDPSGIRCQAEPIFVLGKATAPGLRVRGLVAWVRLHYNVFLGQTFDVANWHTYFPFSGQTGWFPISPGAPFPITDQSGAVAKSLAGAIVTLYAIARPAAGFSYAPTWDRAVWRKPAGVTFFPADGGLNAGGADTAGFSTLFKNGQTTQLTTALRTKLGRHGINVVPSDFMYQLDNPSTPLAANAKKDYFVKAWAFRGAVSAAFLPDADKYPEDTALVNFKVLKDIPTGVTQPTGLGSYVLQVINDVATLTLARELEKPPAAPTP